MYINCKGELIDLSRPKVMGILNLTPDSFYDGGKYRNEKAILKQVEKMSVEGADFIDLGAYSSRPNAKNISGEEELKRLIGPLKAVIKEFPEIRVSVDTFRSHVAREAVINGACMVNDISGGGLDMEMFPTIAQLQVPYVLMHMKGSPQTMQQHSTYKNLVKEMIFYFSEKVFELRQMGVNDLIIDPGFGFSKNLQQNYELLGKLDFLKTLNLPILTGISRKSMLYRLLEIDPEKALNATTVANTIALLKGAHILRVHDIKEAVEAVEIIQKMKDSQIPHE
ncbi:dihydropteroate synthase [Lutimonas saemankumensis]|uniref:dihydropteroate synthase n=1 Tax=Lutimonas saemankumensis TaxID=483016 RepID=UPI001CD4B01C|nr:dihydropteroate synthase [Lutimonas saemankumensis]MCA0930981.1 dihydropteroate synthase [Lutimonas saemankumensis]